MGSRRSGQGRERWTEIQVGGRCNNRCVFCDVSGIPELPLQQLMTVVARAFRGGATGVHLAGGEVTCRHDLKVLLRFLKLSRMPWSIETNARLFSRPEWTRAFAESGLARARVGLHGPREVHDRVTGDASFDQTVAGIRLLREAGVDVEIRCLLTRELVESATAEDMVALTALLPGVPFVLMPPRGIWRAGFDSLHTAAPHLAALRDWLGTLAPAASLAGVVLEIREVPYCLLPTPRTEAIVPESAPASPSERAPQPGAWACVGCARLGTCPGFEPDRWPVGSIDALVPLSADYPGHLVLQRKKTPLQFDLAACPFRAGRRRLAPYRGETWMAEPDGSWSRWLPDLPVSNPVRLDTLLTWGQLWHQPEEGRPVPLVVAAECLACHRLHECPACLIPAAAGRPMPGSDTPARPATPVARKGNALLPVPAEAWSHVEKGPADHLAHEWAASLPDWARKAARDNGPRVHLAGSLERTADLIDVAKTLVEGSTAILVAPVREAWLVAPGATMPPRLGPVDPVRWMRSWRSQERTPLRYALPSPQRRGPFVVEVAGAELAGPLAMRPHRGISLQVTESCMCRCIMCNIVGYFKTPMMPLPRILRTMTEAGLLGIRLVDLFGGEVTLRKDLFALLEQVRWLALDSMFITTGYYVDRPFARRLAEAGVQRVVVSIDGSRPEIHDPIRQLPGLWNRTVRAMRALAAQPTIETFASTVILSENLSDLPALIRLSARCGIRKHEFFLPISGPISSTLPRWPNRNEAARFLDEILPEMERVAAAGGVSIDFRPEIRAWPADRERTLELISSGQYNVHQQPRQTGTATVDPRPFLCQAPGFNLFVTVNGNVYPCDMPALISRDTALGSLAEAGLADLVDGPKMKEFIERAGFHPACRMCVGRYEAVR